MGILQKQLKQHRVFLRSIPTVYRSICRSLVFGGIHWEYLEYMGIVPTYSQAFGNTLNTWEYCTVCMGKACMHDESSEEKLI
jgi:hypothetical protein